MITAAAFTIFCYSSLVLLAAALAFALSFRWRVLRRPALRMFVVFGVFAAAGAYVWIEVGPQTDLRLEAVEHPQFHRAPPLVREA